MVFDKEGGIFGEGGRYGESYADTTFTDGIPDILHEAKIGADFIYKLYKASKADGLIEQNDMYHSVGVDQVDHEYWDLPERQDAQDPDVHRRPRKRRYRLPRL